MYNALDQKRAGDIVKRDYSCARLLHLDVSHFGDQDRFC